LSDIFQISVSALQAFQAAINVTSNNIANASTPGYDVETANLTEAVPQADGVSTVGAGVQVAGITRAYSQAATTQLNTSQSTLAQLTATQNYATEIDNDFGTNLGGLSTAIQSFYNAAATVANDPTSTAARQALLNDAQGVAGSFQSASGQLNALNSDVNSRITADVTQINSISAAIANLNQQIEGATAQSGGQAPNELLDQRDQQISNLSQLVGVTTTTQTDGAINVFVGNGQPLVLEDQSHALTTLPNQFDAQQLEVGSTLASGSISSQITSGDLGGLLEARSQVINPALNQLGQIATVLSQTVNSQQAQGLDLNGNFGAPIFSVGTPTASASSANSDTTTATVSVNAGGLGAFGPDSYVLAYRNGAYSLTDQTTGSSVNFTQGGTPAAPTITANGVTITLSGTPAANDQFLIQPTANAASTFSVVLTDPSKIAAAGAVQSAAADTNTGSGAISSPTVLNAGNAALLTTATIAFTSPTTYTINGALPAQTLPANGEITSANGWQVTITGTPAIGDTFTVKSNAGATGNNTNALALAAGQSTGVLNGGTVSVTGATSALITNLGSQAQQIKTAQAAQTAINTQASTAVQSVSGVNLDEEAANLLKWQQAYQAAAQALTIGNSLFTTLIDSVNGTFS
jgi:flagellar hook-associated protein 1 FlgK